MNFSYKALIVWVFIFIWLFIPIFFDNNFIMKFVIIIWVLIFLLGVIYLFLATVFDIDLLCIERIVFGKERDSSQSNTKANNGVENEN